MIAGAAVLNIAASPGVGRQRLLTVVALADVALLVAVIVVGADRRLRTPTRSPTSSTCSRRRPSTTSIYAGGDRDGRVRRDRGGRRTWRPTSSWAPRDLRKRVVGAGASLVPLIYAGIAAIALMAVPVVPAPDGPHTALGGDVHRGAGARGGPELRPGLGLGRDAGGGGRDRRPAALVWAANTAMLGLSRHVYVLATNRQIPSWLGKLNAPLPTPHVAISVAAVIAFGLVDARPTSRCSAGCLRVRGDARDHDRAPLDHQAADRPSPTASARSGCRSTSAARGAELPLPAIVARGADRRSLG